LSIFSNSIGLMRFRIAGELPDNTIDLYEFIKERLSTHAFRSIDDSSAQESIGWVHINDLAKTDFDNPGVLHVDHYLCFSVRRDYRRVPAAVLKEALDKEYAAYLERNPKMTRVPKSMREDIKERVSTSLLTRALPTPATYDVIWDTSNGLLYYFASSSKSVEIFETLFSKTFTEFKLQFIPPFSHAKAAITDALTANLLAQSNRATTDAVMDIIKSNMWLGQDFLLWLIFHTSEGWGEDSQLNTWIDNKLVLCGPTNEGMQKVTVSGPQDQLQTIKAAIKDGKQPVEATIYMQNTDGEEWKLNLKGETFAISAFKTPTVKMETVDVSDPVSEFQGVLLERIMLIDKGLNYLNSLLSAFLNVRLVLWDEMQGKIAEWVQE